MVKTKLSQLLEYVEKSPGVNSLREIAADLDLSVSQVENMLEFWIRKGRLQQVRSASACGSCSARGGCPVVGFPPGYEVIHTLPCRNTY